MTELSIAGDNVDSLTSDGRVVHLRDLGEHDVDALVALTERVSDRSIYLRYFSPNREVAREYSADLARGNDDQHHAVGAFAGDVLLGVGVLDRVSSDTAEFAVLVDDARHHAGIGTLLIEHVIAEARGLGIRRLVAEVLSANTSMLIVLRELGFAVRTRVESGEMHISFALDLTEHVVDAITARDEVAEAQSLRPMFAPRSVVVVGAGSRAGTVGHEVLRNVLDGGFAGATYVVNPNRSSVLGVTCVPSPADLPEAPDLAVIALPADRVADAVRGLGERGVRAAVLLGAGFGEAGPDGARKQAEIVEVARRYDMRLLGPNCIGLANTDPAVRLDATFGRFARRSGPLAVVSQSGAFGVAVLAAADEHGIGIAQFASIGNKADVGGNDLLLAWDRDPRVRVIAAYLESIGDPRRFARVAAHVGRHKPILAIKSGRSDAGRRAGQSHTAAAASSDVVIDALFDRAGVLRMETMAELLDAARVLADQPLPAGPRIAMVGNSGGPEIMAADAATAAGLVVTSFGPETTAALAALGVGAQNPIDLGAAVSPDQYGAVLAAVSASPDVDAVLSVFTDIAVTDSAAVRAALTAVAQSVDKPLIAVAVGAPAETLSLPGGRTLPVFTFPEPAAAALGAAHRYAEIRRRSTTRPVSPDGVDLPAVRAVVTAALAAGQEWLAADDVATLLAAYGVPVCPQAVVASADEATSAATGLGFPVAVKLAEPGLHKSDLGGVRLGIRDEAGVRTAVAELLALRPGSPLLVQPMSAPGTEMIVGAVHDPQVGPVVMFGAGGVLTELLADRSFALAPLTTEDADRLVGGLRAAPLLDGYRGAPPVARETVTDVLVRIAALVNDVPGIAELDLNPLVCRSAGVEVVDARIRIAEPPVHPDPLVRQLRSTGAG